MSNSATESATRLMNTAQAAYYLGLAPSTLHKWRGTGEGPEFIRLSPRRIMYERPALDTYRTGRRFHSTSEYLPRNKSTTAPLAQGSYATPKHPRPRTSVKAPPANKNGEPPIGPND